MKNKILHDLISIQTDGNSENHQKCIQYITDYIKKEICGASNTTCIETI